MLAASLVLLSAALATAAKTDSLSAGSARLSKRGLTEEGNYNITLFHVNDVHAHLDEFTGSGTDCTDPAKGCYGGYARIKEVLDDRRSKVKDSLTFNVGDEAQGTLFFSFYGFQKIAETINQLDFDAMTLGNHEWDRGDEELGAFLKNLSIPIVSANVQSTVPDLNSTIKPYHIFEKHQLAVIGVTTDTTPDISSVGPGTKFSAPIPAIQATIDTIKANEKNVTRFIAITHVGYDVDMQIAQQVRGLHLIIGGHSHTLLGDMDGAEGKYPTIVKNPDGEDVFIVTSYRWGEYLGEIEVSFNPEGKIVAYTGAPIHLTNATEQEPKLQAQIEAWREPFEEFGKVVIGSTDVELGQSTCKKSDCLLGQVMADAIVDYRKKEVVGAVINGGGVRATIDAGPITRAEVLTAFPFANVIVDLPLTGQQIWNVFEGIFSENSLFNGRAVIPGVQVSKEFAITYNPSNANGTRLITLTLSGQPLNMTQTYTIGTIDFMAKGGDNQLPAQDPKTLVTLDAMDEVLTRYLNASSPIKAQLEPRITTTNTTTSNPGSSGGDDAAFAVGSNAILSVAALLSATVALLL